MVYDGIFQTLLAVARDCHGSEFERINLNDPQFDLAEKCHDWRNHVDQRLIQLWDELSMQTKLCLYLTAQTAASSEEWD